jgi:dolichol-phosphate mannosyltransferase
MFKYKDKISVVLPVKNELDNLKLLIEKILHYTDELIIIDGNSNDGTIEYCKNFTSKIYKDNGKGKGSAIRQSINYVTKPVIVFIDGDGSHNPDDIPKLVSPIFELDKDHVQGSRTRGGSDEYFGDWNKFLRVTGSHLILLMINYKFKVSLTDSQNGFRAIKTEVIKSLNLQEDITTIEQEMIAKTLKNNFSLYEVPTHESSRVYGETKINLFRHSLRYVYSALKYIYFK